MCGAGRVQPAGHPETKGNDKGKLSMLRGSILLDADAATGPIKWKAVARSTGRP
jgi:hypothetical protein